MDAAVTKRQTSALSYISGSKAIIPECHAPLMQCFHTNAIQCDAVNQPATQCNSSAHALRVALANLVLNPCDPNSENIIRVSSQAFIFSGVPAIPVPTPRNNTTVSPVLKQAPTFSPNPNNLPPSM